MFAKHCRPESANEKRWRNHFYSLQQFEFVESFAHPSQSVLKQAHRPHRKQITFCCTSHWRLHLSGRRAAMPCASRSTSIYHFRLWHGNVGAAAITFLLTSSVILIHDHDKIGASWRHHHAASRRQITATAEKTGEQKQDMLCCEDESAAMFIVLVRQASPCDC